MIRVKTSLTIPGLLFILIACSGQSTVSISIETPTPAVSATPTPWVEGTQAALSSMTPWVAGTEAALAALIAETQNQNIPTQAVLEKPKDFSPVLYGGKVYDTTFFLLLGGVNRETWIAPDRSVARFSGNGVLSFSLSVSVTPWLEKYSTCC